MKRNILSPCLAVAALSCLAAKSHAGLLGASVLGSLQFSFTHGASYTPYNWYDPANFGGQLVPVGFLNKTQGTTVVIAEPDSEFGFVDPFLPAPNYASANFTDSSLSVDAANLSPSMVYWKMTFKSSAFIGRKLRLLDSTLPLDTYSLVGDTITITNKDVTKQGFRQADFSLQAAPEPISLIGLTIGLLPLVRRRRL